jgi:hypothetical protein
MAANLRILSKSFWEIADAMVYPGSACLLGKPGLIQPLDQARLAAVAFALLPEAGRDGVGIALSLAEVIKLLEHEERTK